MTKRSEFFAAAGIRGSADRSARPDRGGGRGNVLIAVLGALILLIIFNLVIFLGLPVQAQFILKGLVIIVAAAAFARQHASL